MRLRVRAPWLFLVLAACATRGELPPRPAVALPEPAATIDPGLLIGRWSCRDLNPYPEQPEQTLVATYDADGSFVTESRTAARGRIGPIAATGRGRWTIQSAQLVTRDVHTEARAADGDPQTDLLAKAGAQMVDALSAASPNTAEILQLAPDRLVLRPVGVEDPAVLACTR